MKIRHKTYALLALYVCGVLSIALLLVGSFQKSQRIRDSIFLGMELQLQSREVKSLMKDVVFELFAPQTYSQTRSLTYSPRSMVTLSQWEDSVRSYKLIFDQFMDSSIFLQSSDSSLQDQYLTAMIMNQKAMELLSSMTDTVASTRDTYRREENIYNAMLKDASLSEFFNNFQETSYYFSNSFESFMNYFITSLRDEAERLQSRQYLTLTLVAGLFFTLALLFTVYLTRDIGVKTRALEQGFRDLSLGNFSTRHIIEGGDEFAQLSAGLNRLVLSLKTNTDNILNLSRDISSFIDERSDIAELQELIVKAVLQDSSADGVLLFTRLAEGELSLSASSGDPIETSALECIRLFLSRRIFRSRQKLNFRKEELTELGVCPKAVGDDREQSMPEALLAVPLVVDNRNYGVLVSVKRQSGSRFSDLGVFSLENFGEYASLAIDHFFKYRELLERREAQFLALQSQMQPHFIYNILGGMLGLIRKGDSDALRHTIENLKTMLRYIQSNNKWTVLEDEAEFLENYLALQKIRFGDRLEYHIEIDPSTEHIRIPRLLLQPLVENAVLHGIEPQVEGGKVEIYSHGMRRSGEQGARIRIVDDGAGFDTATVSAVENIGLNNLRQRLQIFMPDARIQIHSSPGGGTQVELLL